MTVTWGDLLGDLDDELREAIKRAVFPDVAAREAAFEARPVLNLHEYAVTIGLPNGEATVLLWALDAEHAIKAATA